MVTGGDFYICINDIYRERERDGGGREERPGFSLDHLQDPTSVIERLE